MAKLGEVCKVSPSTKNIERQGAWLLNLDMVEQQTGRVIEYNYVNEENLKGSIVQFDIENVLYSKLRPNLNKVVLPQKDGFSTSELLPLRPDASVLNKDYLAAFLRSDSFVTWAVSKTAGAKMPRLGTKDLMNAEIPVPSIEQQKKIAEKFKKLEQLISLRKQQLEKLDELIKARFVEMFGDSVANTKNFPSTTLETVMTVFPQNGLYKPQTDYVQDDTGIPILRIDAFYNGKVTNWNTLKRLICSETEIDRYLLRENNIVINRVNSIEYLGKCAHIVGLKEKTVFESNMMRFHMDEKKVNAVYVTEVLCTEGIYRQILRRAKKSVNQASINQEDVKSLEILVPPLSLQNQFAAFVERVDQQKQAVQQSLEKLELMKKALMQEYFG